MSTQQCNACGGVYQTTMPDGHDYYHVCPPLSVVELQTLQASGGLTFSPPFQAQLTAAQTADTNTPVAPGTPTRVQQLYASVTVPRKNARNENIAGPPPDAKTPAPIVSAGAGVTVLGATATPITVK